MLLARDQWREGASLPLYGFEAPSFPWVTIIDLRPTLWEGSICSGELLGGSCRGWCHWGQGYEIGGLVGFKDILYCLIFGIRH